MHFVSMLNEVISRDTSTACGLQSVVSGNGLLFAINEIRSKVCGLCYSFRDIRSAEFDICSAG